MHDITVLHSWF